MEGILDELLRLEDAKHHALVGLDATAYDRSVKAQVVLIEDSRLSTEAPKNAEKLLAFSKLASLNRSLYHNLLITAPWVAANQGYSGAGQIDSTPASRSFSAEA